MEENKIIQLNVNVAKSELQKPDGKPVFNLSPQKKKLCICGFSPTTLWDAFKLDPAEYEFWFINEMYQIMPSKEHFTKYCTRLFEIHNRETFPDLQDTFEHGKVHMDFLRNIQNVHNIPVYMQKEYPDVKNSVYFPAMELSKFFDTKYFTNTISWLIAYAIRICWDDEKNCLRDDAFEEIHLYGIE